ncbi:DUF3887 domain-containing protein [Alcanivorax sp. S6407]|uniref:DUF3887 domain-containing protein n=1 Tax=Alcanivorax sp. S6407 TaxID=2926424 RepID=UPI001FF26E99|nr:DUF3887 domain-containing protein [Alcanivorax sp. S6407]MCK0152929.1 DUF3887 domain-containing protein [Alcanivorax sp. S6407]
MSNKISLLVLLFILSLIAACDVSINAANRSGDIEDDYVAEPLSSMSKKYANALEVSNQLVEYMKAGDPESVYTELLSDSLKKTLSEQVWKDQVSQLTYAKGEIINYKKMQWGFVPFEQDGSDFIASIKIVEHEAGMMKYSVVFNDDGVFDKVVGFHLKERDGVSPPGEF